MKLKMPKKFQMKWSKLAIIIAIGIVAGSIISATISYVKISMQGKYPTGTFVGGVNISHKTLEESAEILEGIKKNYLDSTIEINLANETKESTIKDLGVNIHVTETLHSIKRNDLKNINILKKRNYNFIITIDREKLLKEIEAKFKLSELNPKEAAFVFENGKLTIKQGEKGLKLKQEALINDLKTDAQQLKLSPVTLKMVESEPGATAEQLEKQRGDIEASLKHQLVLMDPIYSDDWYFKLTDHLDWVEFVQKQKATIPILKKEIIINPLEGVEGETFVVIEINQNKLNEFIDAEISRWLDKAPEDVNIYTDENNKIIIEGAGSNGLKIQRKLLKKSIEIAVANKIKNVPIPVIEISPKLNISQYLQEKGIKERIAVGHTSYYGSPANRVHNIKVGSSKFNGLLIEPGEIFSFNQNLGAVDGSTGYKKELVIKKEGTIPEYGGGICQVSTTMFRAALLGGLPIKERNQHSYAVSYYSQILGHGLDATIYLGGADLKFENNTGEHILIQTYTKDDYELYIVFFGTSTGRTVEVEGPYLSNYSNPGPTIYEQTTDLLTGQTKQIEKAHTGFDALWYRYITDVKGNTTKESIATRYRAIPAKVLIGEGEN